mgnify:CR=1 FL=1|tara:strand:- start:1490 stop:2332 length:843 start_codon:yes stop_codon:yes gene_type:complete
MKVGLIGNGFVGRAIYENLKQNYDFVIYDKNPALANCCNISEITQDCKFIFVAVPTPMHLDGSPDLSIVLEVVKEIYENYNNNIVILKSTVVPGTSKMIKQQFSNLRIVFSPEFLTEAHSIEDFKNCSYMIFGGQDEDTHECVNLMESVFPNKKYVTSDCQTSEMVKYLMNCFLSIKVSFANEMKQVCDTIGISYDKVSELALLDDRMGKSHFRVPGPDGFHGFGGKCFPKDLNALMYYCISNNIKPTMLRAAWQKNLEVREEKDWLNIEGAVTKEKKDE